MAQKKRLLNLRLLSKILFTFVILSISLSFLPTLSAEPCTPAIIYDNICLEKNSPYISKKSQWADIPNPLLNYCGEKGFWFIENTPIAKTGELILKISVDKAGNYDLTLWESRGTPGQINEDFTLKCGTNTYTILDNPSYTEEKYRELKVSCTFTAGENQITLTPLGNTAYI